jgi:predicted PurR-regulated permease PerM
MKHEQSGLMVVTSGTVLRAFCWGVLLLLLYRLIDLVLVVITAVVIAAAVEPATRWFARHKISRLPAVLFVYVFSFLLFAVTLYFFVPPLVRDTASLIKLSPASSAFQKTINGSSSTLTAISGSLKGGFNFEPVVAALQSGSISNGLLGSISLIFGGVSSFVLIVVLSFYLAVQEKGIENFLRVVSPIHVEAYVIDVWSRTEQKIGRWMQGQLLLGLIIGPLVYLGLTILGIKYALTLAILAAIFELIPFFGPILSAVPAVILGFSETIPLGLMVVGLYLVIQQFENHLIYPLVVKKVIGIPPLVVILALLAGAKLAGFFGLILAVPVAVLLMELLNDFEKKKQLQMAAGK